MKRAVAPVWYLECTEKCLSELSDFDLIRCIRQKVFINLATFEIIERMNERTLHSMLNLIPWS